MTISDDEQKDAAAPDAPFEPVPTRKALRSIASDFLRPKTPIDNADPKSLSSNSVKEIVNGLDRRERTFGIVLTLLNLWVVIIQAHRLHVDSTAKLRAEAPTFLILGLGLSALIVIGIVIKRRAFLGFCCFLIGLVFLTYGIPTEFIFSAAFGVWLILRAQKAQRLQRGGTTGRSASPRPARAAHQTKAEKAATATVRPPTASKRYTPPKRSGRR